MKKYLEIGRIINKRGIKGELKIEPYSNSTDDFLQFDKIHLSSDGSDEREIASCKEYKGYVYLTLSGINTPESADSVRGKYIYVDREDIRLSDDEVLITDIIGLDVIDANTGKKYGNVKEIVNYGRYDIYVINAGDKEYMMPAVDEFLSKVDIESGVYVTPIPGMFDDAEELR